MERAHYTKLVKKVGKLRYETSGGERHGIVTGVFMACDVLGVELDTEGFYSDILAEENRLYEEAHPNG
jgi:hypothetical protein